MKHRIDILLYSLLILLILSKTGLAQQAGKQVPITTPSTLASPNALLYLPWDYDISGKKYPFILFGHGSNESTINSIGTQGLPGIIKQGNPPYALIKGDTVHFIVLSITGQTMLTDKEMSDGARDMIRRGIRIDTNRIYITGLSAGANKSAVGYISHQMTEHYQPAAATVPMSYTRSIDDLSDSYWVGKFSDYAGKGLWEFVGKTDNLHNVSHIPVAEAIVDSVNKYSPGNGKLTIYPGGHCCWMTYYDPAYREDINGKMMNIYEWLMQYSLEDSLADPPANRPPTADAGTDQTVILPVDSVELNGTASLDADGNIMHYQWEKTSGPDDYAFDNDTLATTEVRGLQAGVYVFTLTVTDDSSASASSAVTVTVEKAADTVQLNQPPTADAGTDQTVILPVDSVELNGMASSDPDGHIVHYRWEKTSGPDAYAFDNDTLAATEVRGLQAGVYVFTLTVTDDSSASASAAVTVTVDEAADTVVSNRPPVADAGTDQTVTLPQNSVALDGSASFDPDGSILSFAWSGVSGPGNITFGDSHTAKTTVSNLKEGTYVFKLTVKDSSGAETEDQVSVTVEPEQSAGPDGNQGPAADAGDDITTVMPLNKVYLDGSRTAEKNKKGGYIFYHWEKVSGPEQYFIKYPDRPVTELRDLVVGVYTFRLTIHINSNGKKVSDIVKVTVEADPMAPGDVPYTANDRSVSYDDLFQYGTNTGSYGNGWDDTTLVSAAARAGIHSIRLPLPEYFVERYNYDVRTDAFDHYTHQLGMKEITLFVGQPSDKHRDHTIYPTASREAATFDHLYEPIWDHGENGTPVNENNYFANYIYNLVKRYGKDVRFWEIVNEPDITGFWDNGNKSRPQNWWDTPPSPGALLNYRAPVFHYIRMLRIAYEVIKKFDPDDLIAPGGIGNPAFLDALLRYTDNPDQGKASSAYPLTGGAYFDVVSFHCYPSYFLQDWDNSINGFRLHRHSDRAAQAVINLKNSFDSVLATRGYTGGKYPKKLFIVTETNIPEKSFGTYFGSVDAQRNFIIKALVDAQKNDIKQLYVFTIGNNADYASASGAYELMGLYENLTREKPGQEKLTDEGKALKTTSMLLYGWRYDSARTRALNLPDSMGGAAFTQGGEYRYVLWAKTNTDLSEEAHATYSFPASFSLDSVYRYEWNYSVDPNAKNISGSTDIALTGAPSFFSEGPVKDSVNRPPLADAGDNQVITLPDNAVTLDASASGDMDGNLVAYRWEKAAGPSSFSMDTTDPVHPQIEGLVQGVYTFTLTVTDDQGATASDNVTITVNQAANQYPIANAGLDQTIMLPDNAVHLDGSASFDPDGTIKTYQWTKKSGPAVFRFSAATAAQTDVEDLVAGTYVFTLTVTDDRGAHTADEVTVRVDALPNKAPVADPGKNITIRLPLDSVVLDGSASYDPDGKITGYAWNQESGPSEAVLGPDEDGQVVIYALGAGTYVFTLTVTDDQGETGAAQVKVIVKQAANQPPIADAGEDRTITLPTSSIILSGTGSADPDGKIASYRWVKASGPASFHFADPDAEQTRVEGLTAGTYRFTLTVKDNRGAVSTADVYITVQPAPNRPPVADAGKDQAITLPTDAVTLDGSASSDPDDSITAYHWIQKSGPQKSHLSDDSSAVVVASGLQEGNYVFTLIVADNKKARDSADVAVTVHPAAAPPRANKAPVADAGQNQSITLPQDSVTLDGSASNDPDGSIVDYRWVLNSGPDGSRFSNDSNAVTKVYGLEAGKYVFTLTVKDDSSATAFDNVTITVNGEEGSGTEPPKANQPPVADAGHDQSITLPQDSVTLDGSASNDPDGAIVDYRWVLKSGPEGNRFSNDSSAVTKVYGLEAGKYVFTLTVKDDSAATASDEIIVVVDEAADTGNQAPAVNQPPVADAGENQSITLPQDSVTLDGSASNDPDGAIVDYRWVLKSGPKGSRFSNDSSAVTKVYGLEAGKYIFTLTVKDDSAATASDEIIVVVDEAADTGNQAPAINLSPVADAGHNQSITLPQDSVTLDGSASNDPDGAIVDYRWVLKSGPDGSRFSNDSSAVTKVYGLEAGKYVFSLTVTDDSSATASDNVAIIVNPEEGSGTESPKANQPPVADAGQNQSITLPQDSVTLDGSTSNDPDGAIVDYRWVLKSSPDGSRFSNDSSAVTKVYGLEAGKYVFTLTVTDDSSATASDNVTIIVNPEEGSGTESPKANQPPVADAGENQSITLPRDSATLDGSASNDPDGAIVNYRWVLKSGPEGSRFSNDSSAVTKVYGLKAGKYVFMLTVTDDSSATATADVTVTVARRGASVADKPANQAPVARAGQHQSVTLPTDSIILDASASSDPDGKIVAYQWTQQAGPVKGAIRNTDVVKTLVSNLAEGLYVFRLVVKDDDGATDTSRVNITVNPMPNQSPSAHAGVDQTIALPLNTITLDGSASLDPDGTIQAYHWSLQSGPGSPLFNNPDTAITTVSGLRGGVYVFTLTVTDNNGATDTASVAITVTGTANRPPVADAGADTSIMLPENSMILEGSRSYDPDGQITLYRWELVSGPSQPVLLGAHSPVCRVGGLAAGVYGFRLTVTDDRGSSSSDEVSIYVEKAKDTTELRFRIYPNPVHDILHVAFSKEVTGIIFFRIVDMNGKIVRTYNYGRLPEHVAQTLDVSGLASGIYLIQLIEDNQLRDVKKMVKY